jgi:hypothetical protein
MKSTEDPFDRFTHAVYKQISFHGVDAGYHSASRPNLLFDFITDFDPTYRHPIGEAISKLKEFARQIDGLGPMNEWKENLEKAAAWIFLMYSDIERRAQLGPTSDRTGSVVDPQGIGSRSEGQKLSRDS